MFTELADLLRYAIGSWSRTWRLILCLTPVLVAIIVAQLAK